VTAAAVKGNGLPGPDQAGLSILPKAKLIAMILAQREDMRIQLEEKDQQITELSERNCSHPPTPEQSSRRWKHRGLLSSAPARNHFGQIRPG
jgi:hypothetical protein